MDSVRGLIEFLRRKWNDYGQTDANDKTPRSSPANSSTLRRRSILQGVTAATLSPTVLGTTSAEKGQFNRDMFESAIEGTFFERLTSASPSVSTLDDNVLSGRQQEIIGKSIEKSARGLLLDLFQNGMFNDSAVELESLINGSAFSGQVFDNTAVEGGLITFYPEPRQANPHTSIQYTLPQSSEHGLIDTETRMVIVVIPETSRAFAIIKPRSILGTSKPNQFNHMIRLIEPGRDLQSSMNESQIWHTEGSHDVVTTGLSWTYCLYGYDIYGNLYCNLQQVECINCECREYTIGSCYSGCTWDKQCQVISTDEGTIEEDPCHDLPGC